MESEHLSRVAALAERQAGVVAAWQAEQVSLSRDQFDRLLESRALKRLRRGLYRLPGAPETWEQKVWAACLEARGVASHRTAAWLWELDGVNRSAPSKIDLVVPFDNKRRAAGAKMHRSRSYVNQHRCLVKGVPCTTLARTVVDLSQVLSGKALEIAVASAVRLEPRLYEQVEKLLAPLPEKALRWLNRLKPLLAKRDDAGA